jgi:hypothetical protein
MDIELLSWNGSFLPKNPGNGWVCGQWSQLDATRSSSTN